MQAVFLTIESLEFLFKNFKSLDGYWVLFWIGRVSTNTLLNEYEIELLFVRLNNGLNDYEKFLDLAENKNNTKCIKISVLFAPSLLIGSVFKDGVFYRSPYTLNERINVEIDNSSILLSKPIRCISNDDVFDSYPKIHKYHNHFIEAGRANASIPKDIDYLLFPCFEIARKYFFKSDALSKRVFAGEIGDKEIYYDQHPDGYTTLPESNNETSYLLLTKDMYDSDAKHIARIKYSERSKASALQIFSSIYGETDPYKKTVDTFFPFEQKSKLEIAGRSLKLGSRNVFFVFHIKSCSAKFLPGVLIHNRVNDGRSNTNGNTKEVKGQHKNKVIVAENNNYNKPIELTDIDKPNYNSAKKVFNFELEDEFGAEPEVKKEEKGKQKTHSQEPIKFTTVVPEIYSTNSTASNNTKTSKAGIETDKPVDPFGDFFNAIKKLKSNGFKLNLLYPSHCADIKKPKYYFSFINYDLCGPAKKWCFLKRNKSDVQNTLRSCVAVELVYNEWFYYILEIQPKYPTESFYTYLINDQAGIEVKESEIHILLHEIANKQGKIRQKNFDSISRISCTKIEHTTVVANDKKNINPEYLLKALNRIL